MTPDMTPAPSPRLSRRGFLGATALGAIGSTLMSSTGDAEAATTRRSQLVRVGGTGFVGACRGVVVGDAGLRFVRRFGETTYIDRTTGRRLGWELAQWMGLPVTLTVPATQLVASWNATTPQGSAVRIKLRARSATGTWSKWFTMAVWTAGQADTNTPTRTTVNGQSDAVAKVSTDTLVAASGVTFTSVQIRVELARQRGSRVTPGLREVCVVASTTPQSSTPVSPVGVGAGHSLAVPAYSQMIHEGHYPAWNGGGEAWCSATSTAMVLDHFGVGASTSETSWVRPTPHVDPQVEQVVRGVWDAGYQGTGNWPFNTAHAATRGLSAFVTRLRSLAEAELFIAAGIPLIVSTSFSKTQLTGAGFGTNGHLMVIRGFDAAGNVLVNDPASGMVASNTRVAKTYDRAQFESAWGRSGGTTYVMHPASRALPARIPGAAW